MSTSTPAVAVSVADLRDQVASWRAKGLTVGFVPTMGALHEGHLSLVRIAKSRADRVAASIFVNPKQFAPTEDLDRYPRQEAKDAELLSSAGCDLVFLPTPELMYPPGFSTAVTVGGPSQGLESDFRPQFFAGVATVVTKLLVQAGADVAVFGEKDYQQLQVVRRLVADLDLPVEIVAGPTVREADGLAMSSRNAYLDPAERAIAAAMNRVLALAVDDARAGRPADQIELDAAASLLAAGYRSVDYVAVRDADTLAPFPGSVDRPARVLAAAWLGSTRLIDNLTV